MEFRMDHTNINVLDLEKSLAFYKEALGLHETGRETTPDGSAELVFISDAKGGYEMELTHLHGRTTPYDLSDNEIHIAFRTAQYEEARKKHREMGCICMENDAMGLYFIEDPDGYWLEILPEE